MTKIRSIIYFSIVLFLFSCTTRPDIEIRGSSTVIDGDPTAVEQLEPKDWVGQTLQNLTLREKISQMLIYSMNLDIGGSNTTRWEEISKIIETDGIGGIHLWKGSTELALTALNKLQRMSKIPIIVDMDIEKGMDQRFPNGTQIPPAMALAATGDSQNAFDAGKIVGMEALSVGVHWNFAPVVDVNNNPDNPIINTRAFSDDVDVVTEYAIQYINGLQSGGLLATAKHFPGHGDTKTDSHKSLASIPSDSTRLWSVELAPYGRIIEAGVDAIMISHLIAPDYQPNSYTPATLSKFWIQDILRDKLNFKGAVVTDAMDMGGVTNGFSDAYALINAVNAGCDIIIQRHKYTEAIDILEKAVEKGIVSESRINEAAVQMLKLKEKVGLNLSKEIKLDQIQQNFGIIESQKISENIAKKSITMVKNSTNLLPIKISDTLPTTIIDIYGSKTKTDTSEATKVLTKYRGKHQHFVINESDDNKYVDSIISKIKKNTLVILNVFAKPSAWKGTVSLNNIQSYLVKSVAKKSKYVVMVSFGNPYIIRDFHEVPSYLCAWESQSNLQKAGAEAIFAINDISGKLPIKIPQDANLGNWGDISKPTLESTVNYPKDDKLIFKTVMPFEAGADISNLSNILRQAVSDSAFPGGAILAIKDNKIFLTEAFGYHTYSKNRQVGLGSIFDLASLTKVIATTTAIMKLYDNGKIKLYDPVSKYIPEFMDSWIGNTDLRTKVTIKQLLTHTSGLPPFRQFHKIDGNIETRWDAVYKTELENIPGKNYVYSDVGFLILGKIVERITGIHLDKFVAKEIFNRMDMMDTFYNPVQDKFKRIVPTEFSEKHNGYIRGIVHDENAYGLGGVAGHAGLFSTTNDLANFSFMMLNGGDYKGKRIIKESTVDLFTKIADESKSSRCLGWDSPSGSSSGGVYLSDSSFGHTGFTGTSMWIDPENNIAVILLTNAVHPFREWKSPKYFDWRQKIHSEVYESIGLTNKNSKLTWRKNWNVN